jgi:hypothetical protein
MITFQTICLIGKESQEVTELKKTIRSAGLYLSNGAMNVLTDPEIYTLNSIDLITLLFEDNNLIGWASIVSGFSTEAHPKDKFFPTYPHVGAFISLEKRNQGYARQALDVLLDSYVRQKLGKEYSFKTFGYSVSDRIFKPSLLRYKLRGTFRDALPVSQIELSFDRD